MARANGSSLSHDPKSRMKHERLALIRRRHQAWMRRKMLDEQRAYDRTVAALERFFDDE